jgi:uroporphyrinogen decarboxylase
MSNTPNRREAVFAALRFEEQRPCPYYIWVDDAMVPPLAACFGAKNFVGAAGTTRTFAGSYTAMTEVAALPIEENGDCYVDDFGARIRRGAELGLVQPALSQPSLAGYCFPDLATPRHFAHLDGWLRLHAERFRIVQLGMLFFERSWFMRGMENLMMDFHLHPAFVHELLAGLESVCASVIDRLLRDCGDRIDAIGMSEDYGTQKSMMISPAVWREFIKPGLTRLVAKIRGAGKQAYIHSCGHILPVIGDLVEIGVTMLQPIQPEAMDVFEVKRRFGKNLCLMGGISTQHTLQQAGPDDVRREVRACLDRMAAGGGYVMAPAKSILPGVPVENAAALIEEFTRQSR